MTHRFIYSDKADLYLKGKLSGSERIDFEEKMQKDPLLQSEMKLQQEVYQTLGEARKAGLKARLNQIPIDQSPWFAGTAFKMAAVVSALVVTSVATYVVLSPSESDSIQQLDINKTNVWESTGTATKMEAPEPTVEVSVADKGESEAIEKPDERPLTTSTQPAATEAEVRRPTIQRPNVTADFSEDDVQIDYSDFEVPQKQALQAATSMESEVTVEKVLDTVYPFHYQFYNGKLFLHGDFQDAPYKIIALNTGEGRNLFLEYEGYYYRIEEQETITPLVGITDTSLIQELQRLNIMD